MAIFHMNKATPSNLLRSLAFFLFIYTDEIPYRINKVRTDFVFCLIKIHQPGKLFQVTTEDMYRLIISACVLFFFMREDFIQVPPLDVHCKKTFK